MTISSSSFEGRNSRTSKPDSNKRWDPGRPGPNHHLSVTIAGAMVASANDGEDMVVDDMVTSRTELDSHANMVVVGRHALVVSDTGRTAEVNPFTPDYEALQQVPIVDAAICYTCPYTDSQYYFIVRNALLVP